MTAPYPKKLRGEATLETRPRVLNIRLGRRALERLSTEQRRALALFRAADFASDPHAVDGLLCALGDRGLDSLKIGKREVSQLAREVRERGYPLTDDGIRVFKMERGFSEAVRIGPHVAEAYARFLEGREARINVSREEWAHLPSPLRRAIRILMRIGRQPERLLEVRRALGIEDRPDDRAILVGKVSGEALLRWADAIGWSFDREGFRRFRATLADRPGDPDESLVHFVTESVIARDEPVHDYERVTRANIVLNRRTVAMLSAAKRELRGEVKLGVVRGSYCGDEKGAHPHQGGGVVDLSVKPADGVERAVSALRGAGFAAWHRARFDHHHVHAVAIGDRTLAPSAQWQVGSFFEGKDGRTRGAPDPHRDLPYHSPAWVEKYGVRYR